MPKMIQCTETVQGRVSPTLKLKMLKYKDKYKMTEGEIIRRALERFLHNVNAKTSQKVTQINLK